MPAILAAGMLAALPLAAQNTTPGLIGNPESRTESTTRLIVKLRPSADDRKSIQGQATGDGTANRISALGQRLGLAQRGSRSLGGDLSVLLLERPLSGTELGSALELLRTDPEVEFVEIDQRRRALALPTDPLYPDQWYLQAAEPAAVNFTAAWDLSTGTNDTVIAVLDTGVRFDHPDLGRSGVVPGGRLLAGHDFVSGESSSSFASANDGDGWDTDPSDPGDWVSASEAASGSLARCEETGSSWHGTRVAGIVGAMSDNMEGIAGGTWNAPILPVRVLGKCGGYDSDIIAAMRWAAGLNLPGAPLNPTPAKILNLSLGGSGKCTSSYQQVIGDLETAGVLVVAAAGNDHGPVDSPANCPGVLAVAGLRHIGTKVGYSSLGREVGISAPAGNCVNLGPPCLFSLATTSNTGSTVPGFSTYTSSIGTSFAVPMVSAIAGLIHAVNSELSNSEIIGRIKSGARPFPAVDPAIPVCPDLDGSTLQCNCTTTTCGAGMADAPGAISEALRPIARIANPGSAQAGEILTLDGTASAAARGRTVASYLWSVSGSAASLVGTNTQATATLEVSAAGTANVQLTVTDDVGAQDSISVAVNTTSAGGSNGGGGGGGLMHPLLLALLFGVGWYRSRRQVAAYR
jgi:serine protease